MLKALSHDNQPSVGIEISQAKFPTPFTSTLEYSAPARGTWNIVHTGMLIPEAHQIFVCAGGCLRGVVLTAAEMNASDRYSTVAVRENNVVDGDMESLIIDGVTDILDKLPKMPPAVLLYTSCIHHFMATDLKLVFRTLRERFPEVKFTDCYMNPTLRKSGLTPDQIMRRQLYSFLEPTGIDSRSINIVGNDLPTFASSELCRLIRENGFTLRDITGCTTFDEYMQMSKSAYEITYNPAAIPAGDELAGRLEAKHIYVPLSYNFNEIQNSLDGLSDALGISKHDFKVERDAAEQSLIEAQKLIGRTPIELDYTLTFKPLGLTRLLLNYNFNITTIYADAFIGEEKSDFEYLQANYPHLKLMPTVHPSMRFEKREREEKILALGQKAAYFSGSQNFVNIVETGGMFGCDGIKRLADEMKDAFLHEKDMKNLIQIKGWGCSCAL